MLEGADSLGSERKKNGESQNSSGEKDKGENGRISGTPTSTATTSWRF